MVRLGKHPSNNPFPETFRRTREPIASDPDFRARMAIRSRFPVAGGFTTDPYQDDPAAQAFTPSGVAGLSRVAMNGGLSQGLGSLTDDVAQKVVNLTGGSVWKTLAVGAVAGFLVAKVMK